LQLPPPFDALKRNCSKGFEKYHSRKHIQNKLLTHNQKAFTLAEVLIALVVIGIIAAITVPNIIQSVQNYQFKSAYKKAYSDFSQVVQNGIANRLFPQSVTTVDSDRTFETWKILKEGFKTIKVCESNNNSKCWNSTGEKMLNGYPTYSELAFIDVSGRAWSLYINAENIFLVDVNGNKKPNKFGKDRFIFRFKYDTNGYPKQVIPAFNYDEKTANWYCHYPPCYFKSWLLN
jgi:prepilin-type N-terminal cleavage/methylation domain-containing protein